MLKIAIYTIAKNETSNVVSWHNSNRDADYHLVCDTGSTDNTVDALRAAGITVVPITVDPWRFDVARGCALNLLPADIDICIWQDLDEQLLPDWRENLVRHWTPETTTAFHRYKNNDNPWQWHSKIHARHGCTWTGIVHETLSWHIPQHTIWLHDVWLREFQDVTKDRSKYLQMLVQKVAEGDRDWKTYYFLANEYQSTDFNKSVQYREQSFDLCMDGPIAKSYIARTLAVQYGTWGQDALAERWFQTSISISNERESWYHRAMFYKRREQWDFCLLAVIRCTEVTAQRDGYTFDPDAWSPKLYECGIEAATATGMLHHIPRFQTEIDKLFIESRGVAA